jgi:hypothetical protein
LLDRIRLKGFDHAVGLDSPVGKFASEIYGAVTLMRRK